MKEYKVRVIEALSQRAEGEVSFSLKETAQSVGVNRLNDMECIEIGNRFLKTHSDYELVKLCTHEQMRNPATASLWETGNLCVKGTWKAK